MTVYRKKHIEQRVDAYPVSELIATSRGQDAQELPDWLVTAVSRGDVSVLDLGGDIAGATLETPAGRFPATQGAMLVFGAEGEMFPCSAEVFVATYEVAE